MQSTVSFTDRILSWIEQRKDLCLLLVGLLACLYSFYGLGASEIQSWDEALYGQYAVEMLKTGDPVNYYYGSELETWNGKPPLVVWAIAGSYSLFGYNEFALRFPSAIACVGFFMLFFGFVSRYRGNLFALFACLVLMGGHGIVGEHVGRTGDTDMIFTLIMLAFAIKALAYFESERLKDALWMGVFLALAFYTKSIACLFLMPGLLLYLLLKKQLWHFFRKKETWAAVGLFLLLSGVWIVVLLIWGKEFPPNRLGSKNALETMFIYDGVKRFADPSFVEENPWKLDFVWVVLDTKLNLWNYLFIGLFAAGLGFLVTGFKRSWRWLSAPENRLFLFSLSLFLTASLFFTLSRNKNGWYYSPILPFVAILLVEGLLLLPRQKVLAWLWVALTLFLLGRRFTELGWKGPGYREFFAQHADEIQGLERSYFHIPGAEPSAILYLSWLGGEVREWKEGFELKPNSAFFAFTGDLPAGFAWQRVDSVAGRVLAVYE